jgi:hypothetical protein
MMTTVRRALVVAAVAGIAVPVALAAGHEPQKKFTRAGQARARAVSIRASDLGAGWKAERSKSRDQSQPRCAYYDPDQSDLVEIGDYDSPDFTRPDGTFVSSTTGVFRSVQMARTGYARVAVAALPRCFGDLFRKSIGKPYTLTITSAGPRTIPPYGDRSNGYRVTATLSNGTSKVPLVVDIATFNRGAVDVAAIFLGIGRALPDSFQRTLVERLAARAG